MKKLGLIFIILLVAFLTSCSSQNREAYEKNLALWESKAIQHYRFNLKVGCNCPWYSLMPLKVEVKNGEMLSMVASNGGDITPFQDTFRPRGTVEGLFDTVYAAMIRGAYKLEIKYDGTYGFPASTVIDQSRMMTDDAIGYYVTDFEVLP
jgi:hypothetical protein